MEKRMRDAGGVGAAGPLAGYEDWVPYLRDAPRYRPAHPDAARLAAVLGVRRPLAAERRVVREWCEDGVRGRELEWRLPYGPATTAYLLVPDDVVAPVPGLLGMHCHGGVRSTGAEQLVRTDRDPSAAAARLRAEVYDGKAPANDLAMAGFAVLVHDTFSWGSRAFDLSAPTPRLAGLIAAQEAAWREAGIDPAPDVRFDAISGLHEDSLAKAAGMLGTSLAGAVAADDLAALDVLSGLPEVDPTRIGVFGLSGGGGRAALLGALDPRVSAVVITCMMATFDSLVPAYLDVHSWLLHSPRLREEFDWPEVAAIGGGRRTLVQYGRHDLLFPERGMRAAHEHLEAVHPDGGYRGAFHDAGHESTAAMQAEAAELFAEALQRRA
ncbi:acetylxylan esterase [Microbacterium sp. NPDC055903]